MVQLQAKLPVLSDAEKNMHKSLKSIDAKLQDFHASVKEVCVCALCSITSLMVILKCKRFCCVVAAEAEEGIPGQAGACE